MKVNLPTAKKARIEMMPLMDIVFLLLVVFIYSMLSMSVHRGMPVKLPVSSVAKPEKALLLSITIKEDNQIFVNDTPVAIKDLAAYFKEMSEDPEDLGVLLFAHKDLPYQNLFNVLDQIQVAGLSKISLQAELRDNTRKLGDSH